jgi:hypothetical protein
MTVRVTRTFLEVLTTVGTPLNGFTDGSYDDDYTTYQGAADGTYQLSAPLELNGFVDAQYSLPKIASQTGFTDTQYNYVGLAVHTASLGAHFSLDARTGFTGAADSQHLLSLALNGATGWADGFKALEVLQALNSNADSQATLAAAFEGMTGFVSTVYALNKALVAANGYTDAEYEFDAWVPANGYTDSQHDLLAFLQRETRFGSEYTLDTFLQLEGRRNSQYGLAAGFVAAQGYADSLHELQVRGELTGWMDTAFSLEALQQATAYRRSSWVLNKALAAVNGFADAPYALQAYLPASGFTDGQYDIDIFVGLTGFADASYELQALLEATGYTDGNYFLDVTEAVYTWVVNQNTGAPARYEGHDFHSFGRIGRSYLGAKADGIYLLEGDDDGGSVIDAIASTGRMDFGSTRMKRVLAAYLGVDSAGQVNITLRTDANHSYGPYQFRVMPTGHQVERAKFAKGIKSRYWEFDLENVDGGDMSIDEIEFDVIELLHRLKR